MEGFKEIVKAIGLLQSDATRQLSGIVALAKCSSWIPSWICITVAVTLAFVGTQSTLNLVLDTMESVALEP